MDKEDFKRRMFRDRVLLLVPELPGDKTTWARCQMCLACPDGERDTELCHVLRHDAGCTLPGVVPSFYPEAAGILLPEEQFEEYVAEFVGRRISS